MTLANKAPTTLEEFLEEAQVAHFAGQWSEELWWAISTDALYAGFRRVLRWNVYALVGLMIVMLFGKVGLEAILVALFPVNIIVIHVSIFDIERLGRATLYPKYFVDVLDRDVVPYSAVLHRDIVHSKLAGSEEGVVIMHAPLDLGVGGMVARGRDNKVKLLACWRKGGEDAPIIVPTT